MSHEYKEDSNTIEVTTTIYPEGETVVVDVIRLDDVTPQALREAVFGLIILEEVTSAYTECPGDGRSSCGEACPCYLNELVSATLEILFNGDEKDEARRFLDEEFQSTQGLPRVFH